MRDGDGWVLNGTKNFITNGPVADVMVVFAMTDATKGSRGITAFLVPTDTPGLTLGQPDDKLGIRGAPSAQVFFDRLRAPATTRCWARRATASRSR